MTVIVRGSPRLTFHTDLREVVAALAGAHLDYLWFLSDLEVNPTPDEPLPAEFEYVTELEGHRDRWVTGARLDEIAKQYTFQVIWGVLSAFPPHSPTAGGKVEPLPVAEPWDGPIQHPDAEIEIVAFDSTFTAITARDLEVEEAFRRYFA